MKIVGLDLGNASLGIAISDETNFLARPIENFRFSSFNFQEAIKKVQKLVNDEQAGKIVLGLPKNMDGSIGEQGKITMEFAEKLKELLDIEIILWDERLTSKFAHSMMKAQNLKKKKRKNSIDAMAATIILQSYLDNRKGGAL